MQELVPLLTGRDHVQPPTTSLRHNYWHQLLHVQAITHSPIAKSSLFYLKAHATAIKVPHRQWTLNKVNLGRPCITSWHITSLAQSASIQRTTLWWQQKRRTSCLIFAEYAQMASSITPTKLHILCYTEYLITCISNMPLISGKLFFYTAFV